MELHYIPSLVLLLMSCYIQNGHALRCYHCTVNGPSSDLKCNGTIRNCNSNEQFCNIYTSKGSDNISDFTRACVSADVCQPNYCKDTIIGLFGKVECSNSCCKGDLCNRDIIVDSFSTQQKALGLQVLLLVMFALVYVS